MDPHIKPFEILRGERRRGRRPHRLRGGHPQEVRRSDARLPRASRPTRSRRWRPSRSTIPGTTAASSAAGDNQIAGVGDGFARNSAALDRDGQGAPPRFPGLRQRLRRRTRCCGASSARRTSCCGSGCIRTRSARFVERISEFAAGARQGPDQGRGRAAGRHGDLGRRRLPQGPVLLARLLAAGASSRASRRSSTSATRTACR